LRIPAALPSPSERDGRREPHRKTPRFDRIDSEVDATNRTIWAGILVAVMVKFLFG
jgi:hypothetical protein